MKVTGERWTIQSVGVSAVVYLPAGMDTYWYQTGGKQEHWKNSKEDTLKACQEVYTAINPHKIQKDKND